MKLNIEITCFWSYLQLVLCGVKVTCLDRSHPIAFVNNTVIYLVNNITYIGNTGTLYVLAKCTGTVSCIWLDDGSTELKHVTEFLVLLPIKVVLLTK